MACNPVVDKEEKNQYKDPLLSEKQGKSSCNRKCLLNGSLRKNIHYSGTGFLGLITELNPVC